MGSCKRGKHIQCRVIAKTLFRTSAVEAPVISPRTRSPAVGQLSPRQVGGRMAVRDWTWKAHRGACSTVYSGQVRIAAPNQMAGPGG